MSRVVPANLVGRGPDWLKKIERGERELRGYTLLVRLATALRIVLVELARAQYQRNDEAGTIHYMNRAREVLSELCNTLLRR
jgi:hypothetical protein